jgi:hypothetical protein
MIKPDHMMIDGPFERFFSITSKGSCDPSFDRSFDGAGSSVGPCISKECNILLLAL